MVHWSGRLSADDFVDSDWLSDALDADFAQRVAENPKISTAGRNNNRLLTCTSKDLPITGGPRSPHFGLDIAGPVSTPIVAPAGGKVTLAEKDFLLEGGIVVIDHGFGVSSTLFHMHTVEVGKGQRVQAGQRIGSIGATGRASGPHVDWRVNWFNVRLDPALLLETTE